jgi:hypothetical protein
MLLLHVSRRLLPLAYRPIDMSRRTQRDLLPAYKDIKRATTGMLLHGNRELLTSTCSDNFVDALIRDVCAIWGFFFFFFHGP